jgi:hypothetical protein
VLKEVAFVPLVVTDLVVVGPTAHDAVSIVNPFGRTPLGRRAERA